MSHTEFLDFPQPFLQDANGAYQVLRKGEPLAHVDANTGDVVTGAKAPDGYPYVLGRVNLPLKDSDQTITTGPTTADLAKQWNYQLERYPVAISGFGNGFPVLTLSSEEMLGADSGFGRPVFLPNGEGVMQQLPAARFLANVQESMPGSMDSLLFKGFDEERSAQILSSLLHSQAVQAKLLRQTGRASGFTAADLDRAVFETILDIDASGGNYFDQLREAYARDIDLGAVGSDAVQNYLKSEGATLERQTGAQPYIGYKDGRVVGRYGKDTESALKAGENPIRSAILTADDGSTASLTAPSALSLPNDANAVSQYLLDPKFAPGDSFGIYSLLPGSYGELLRQFDTDPNARKYLAGQGVSEADLNKLTLYMDQFKRHAAGLRDAIAKTPAAKTMQDLVGSPNGIWRVNSGDVPGLALGNVDESVLLPSIAATLNWIRANTLMRSILTSAKNASKAVIRR